MGIESQAAQSFLHLLAVANDGSHEPQTFRLRWDQPLRRFARAYAVFRELSPELEASLRLSTTEHPELDLDATASTYAFCDGQEVLFTAGTPPPEISASPTASQRAATMRESQGVKRVRLSQKSGKSSQVSQSLVLASQAKASQAKGKAKAKPKGKAKAKAKAKASPKAAAKAKAKAKAKAAKAKQPVLLKAKPKVKAKAKAPKEPKEPKGKSTTATAVVKAEAPEPEDGEVLPGKFGEPRVPRGRTCAASVSFGPAKGWRVIAWLKEVNSVKERAHDLVICWKILSPQRTRAFNSFQYLKKAVGEGVYTQIFTAVRPGLLSRIRDKRNELEGVSEKRPKKRPANTCRLPPPEPLPPSAASAVAPRKAIREACLAATQIFDPQDSLTALEEGVPWKNGCFVRLRRHEKCISGGREQPQVIYISDRVLIGRGDACDVKLDSMLTPMMISRSHALVCLYGDQCFIEDQGSMNGVHVNGQRISGKQELQSGDLVTFGVPSSQAEFDYVFETRAKE